jgi:hypothetical protein
MWKWSSNVWDHLGHAAREPLPGGVVAALDLAVPFEVEEERVGDGAPALQ